MFIISILDKLNDGESASVVDSKTGMYKAREYKPKSYLPKIREFKPKNREFKPREFEPKKEVTVHTYDKLREYNHFYDAEPPEDETNRPAVGGGRTWMMRDAITSFVVCYNIFLNKSLRANLSRKL